MSLEWSLFIMLEQSLAGAQIAAKAIASKQRHSSGRACLETKAEFGFCLVETNDAILLRSRLATIQSFSFVVGDPKAISALPGSQSKTNEEFDVESKTDRFAKYTDVHFVKK